MDNFTHLLWLPFFVTVAGDERLRYGVGSRILVGRKCRIMTKWKLKKNRLESVARWAIRVLKNLNRHMIIMWNVRYVIVLSSHLLSSLLQWNEDLNGVYLDNTKLFIFGFVTWNSYISGILTLTVKKFFKTVNFLQKKAKTAPKRSMIRNLRPFLR